MPNVLMRAEAARSNEPGRRMRFDARQIRAALLGLAERCMAEARPYPKTSVLAPSYGRNQSQIARHVDWLAARDIVRFEARGHARFVVQTGHLA